MDVKFKISIENWTFMPIYAHILPDWDLNPALLLRKAPDPHPVNNKPVLNRKEINAFLLLKSRTDQSN